MPGGPGPIARARTNRALLVAIRALHEGSRHTYGSSPVTCGLRAAGHVVGENRVARLTARLAQDALTMAIWRRKTAQGLLRNSDRGAQYASGDYQGLLVGADIACSMSRNGGCWDNACVESCFGALKKDNDPRPALSHARCLSRCPWKCGGSRFIRIAKSVRLKSLMVSVFLLVW